MPLSAARSRRLALTAALALALACCRAEEKLPEPEALVSYPRGDLYAAADGGYQQSSYGGYQPPSYGYQPPSYGYQPPSYGYQPPSYGYGHGDDCGDLDLLGVLAGGGALAALGVYVLVTQANMARSARPNQLADFEAGLSGVFLGPPRFRNFADATVNVTCRVAEMLAGDEGDASPARQLSGGSDCFSGIVGALAGFAALGALIAYALFLASQAAMNRSFHTFGFEIDEKGLSLAAQMALVFLQPEQPDCLPHQLCRLSQRARRVGPTHYLAARLASLPAGWFLSSRMAPADGATAGDREFLRLCRDLTADGVASACDQRHPVCVKR